MHRHFIQFCLALLIWGSASVSVAEMLPEQPTAPHEPAVMAEASDAQAAETPPPADDALRLPVAAAPVYMTSIRPLRVTPELNPYYAEFSIFDNWVLEHAVEPGVVAQRPFDRPPGPAPAPDLYWLDSYLDVDAHGRVIPTLRRFYEVVRSQEWRDSSDQLAGWFWSNSPYRIGARGWIDRATFEDMWFQRARAQARLMPRVPAWLAASPPRVATLMPNGEVVTQGELGAGERLFDAAGWRRMIARQQAGTEIMVVRDPGPGVLIRYSPTGVELGRYPTGKGMTLWRDIYFPQYRELYAQSYRTGQQLRTVNGYHVLLDSYYGNVLQVWDFDGTPLEARQVPVFTGKRVPSLTAESLVQLHRAQQELGL
jgi:hypothetical protein